VFYVVGSEICILRTQFLEPGLKWVWKIKHKPGLELAHKEPGMVWKIKFKPV
jgi:hypothetical protein